MSRQLSQPSEGGSMIGALNDMAEERARYKAALERLDGKVEAGWRQAVITRALRPGVQIDPRDVQGLEVDQAGGQVINPAKADQAGEIHTCHEDCPCHTGGKPRPDFIGGM